jgi:hypothetical protein
VRWTGDHDGEVAVGASFDDDDDGAAVSVPGPSDRAP